MTVGEDYDAAAIHTFSIYAVDPNGNRTETREISVVHPGFGDLNDIVLMVDGTIPESGSISTSTAAEDLALTVMGVTSDGKRFAMDPSCVFWRSFASDGSITVDDDGKMDYSVYAKGFVEAMVEVSKGAYRTVSIALNAEASRNMVLVSTTVGGRVTGGGEYSEGANVILTAIPEDRYRFDHWEVTGVSGLDLSTETLSFIMPGNTVSAKACFVSTVLPGDLNGDGRVNALDLIRLKKHLLGENVVLFCSADLNGDGQVNALDLIRFKKYLLSESVELH